MSKRPSYSDDAINAKLAQVIAEKLVVLEEMPDDPEELLTDLTKVLKSESPFYDPYKMAKALEDRFMWTCNMGVVELLDTVSNHAYQLLSELVAEWVSKNGIEPKNEIGDRVIVSANNMRGIPSQYTGEIVRINEKEATYTILIPELGHVRSGIGTNGGIFPFEEIHPLATPAAKFTLSMH